jgi:hypothetical protein
MHDFISRRAFIATLPLRGVGLSSAVRAQGDPPGSAGATLFQNVRIFDGRSNSLSAPSSVRPGISVRPPPATTATPGSAAIDAAEMRSMMLPLTSRDC